MLWILVSIIDVIGIVTISFIFIKTVKAWKKTLRDILSEIRWIEK